MFLNGKNISPLDLRANPYILRQLEKSFYRLCNREFFLTVSYNFGKLFAVQHSCSVEISLVFLFYVSNNIGASPIRLGQHSTPLNRGMSLVVQRGQFYANAACSPFLFCILACLPVFPPQNCIFIPPHFGEGDEGETSQQKRLDTNN